MHEIIRSLSLRRDARDSDEIIGSGAQTIETFREVPSQLLYSSSILPFDYFPISLRYPLPHPPCLPCETLPAPLRGLPHVYLRKLSARNSPYSGQSQRSSRRGRSQFPVLQLLSTSRLCGDKNQMVRIVWTDSHGAFADPAAVKEELVAKLQNEITMEEDMKEDEDLSANIKEYLENSPYEVLQYSPSPDL